MLLPGTLNEVHGLLALTFPESLLQMHNGRPHARSTESESAFLIKAPGVWLAHKDLRCPLLRDLLDSFFNGHEIMPS